VNKLTDFAKGIIIGFCIGIIVAGLTAAIIIFYNKERAITKEFIEHVEKQQVIETMREDYINRDPYEFFEVPGVRGAADGAIADFERRRDEAVQRFRNRLTD